MMSQTYGLYQTFSSDTPLIDLTHLEKNQIKEGFSFLNQEQKKAVFFLIIEHAKISENFLYDPSNLVYPYGLVQNEDSIEFDLDNLPIKLKWILFKFNKVINKIN